MINKDYILRLAERFGRELAILLHLRKSNRHEEALITIDDLFLRNTGLTTHFINSAPEDMLLKMISPLGILNLDKCLWIAVLLKEEGNIYAEIEKPDESYYRYVKSLRFFLEAALTDKTIKDVDIASATGEILQKLEEFELPFSLKTRLFRYFELTGSYNKAEDILFEMVESDDSAAHGMRESGREFYQRLLKKQDTDLQAGDFSRQKATEGLENLEKLS